MAQGKLWLRVAARMLGGAVLVLGLWYAAQIHRQAASQHSTGIEASGDVAAVLHPEDFKRGTRDMEMFGGKSMVLLDRARRWLSGPEGADVLAILVGLGSLLVGAGLILAADRLTDEVPPGDTPPPGA